MTYINNIYTNKTYHALNRNIEKTNKKDEIVFRPELHILINDDELYVEGRERSRKIYVVWREYFTNNRNELKLLKTYCQCYKC